MKAVLVVCGVVLVPLMTRAAITEALIYPASMCVAEGDSIREDLFFDQDFGVRNENTYDPQTIVCPVPRENLSGAAGTNMLDDFHVYYVDAHSSYQFSCALRACNMSTGAACFSDVISSTAVFNSNATQKMDWNAWAPGSYVVHHAVTLECTIPPKNSGVGGASSWFQGYAVNHPG